MASSRKKPPVRSSPTRMEKSSARGSLPRHSRATVISTPVPPPVTTTPARAAGSNLSPTNPLLAGRAAASAAIYGSTLDNPVPADLVTASGSGLDPDISLEAADYQIPRVAAARGLVPDAVRAVIDQVKRPLTGKTGALVNVLELNLALDAAR